MAPYNYFMSAYNFQSRFVPQLEAGTKLSTIRARRKDGRVPKVGELLALYTGMRTKKCKLIGYVTCTAVRRITISIHPASAEMIVGNVRQSDPDWYSRRDGFKDFAELCAWFLQTHGSIFHGHLIEWA